MTLISILCVSYIVAAFILRYAVVKLIPKTFHSCLDWPVECFACFLQDPMVFILLPAMIAFAVAASPLILMFYIASKIK